MATAHATPEKMTLDRTDGSATIALYRAALGPVHTDYYLKAFTRFDASGKAGPLWNWTAALLTLNWLLFRQLWVAALAYTGALVAAALLLVGIARLVFQLSGEVQWLLTGLGLLLAVGLPGALGNAWLYAACNKRMERALVASTTLDDACAALAAKAVGRKHMGGLLAGNLTLGALVLGLVASWPDSRSLPLDPGQQTRAIPVEFLHSGLATQTVGAASTPQAVASAPTPTPALVPMPAPSPSASAPVAVASRTSQGLVQPAAVPTALTVQASASAEPAKPAASTPSAASLLPVATGKPPEPARAVAAATQEKKHLPAHEARAEKAAKPAHAASATASSSVTASTSVTAAEEKFLINVGLFADENNARNAMAKLQDAGLPALSQPIQSAKGARTRVRVGPFETQAEADRVAEKIRSLQLEAQVFKP
jgi:cell division septation protein DedD